MSTETIVKRLMESRLHEDSEGFNYVFNIPWREVITYGDPYTPSEYHYGIRHMDYAGDIMDAAKEDFNDADIAKYTTSDSRTKDCNILKMTMDFNNKGDCLIKVITSDTLGQSQIDNIIDYLEGQMSDGWGEGFEQRDIVTYTVDEEEWVEDEEEEDGGYYEDIEVEVVISGQFWWRDDDRHPYQIELVGDPMDKE